MASSGGSAEAGSGFAPACISSSRRKVKRTPVILNIPCKPAGAHFKVLQWNVLADGLAQNGDFCRVPPGCLEWEYRKPLLLQEILEASADIVCLQELNHFEELRQALSDLGYEGAFRAKHASPALKYEYPPDGMAVFYRRTRFAACGGEEGIQGRSFQDRSTGREQSQGFLQILLRDMLVGRQLLVVTTHLKAKEGDACEDVRLQQARQLLGHISDTLQRLQQQQPACQGAQEEGRQPLREAAAANGTGIPSISSSAGSDAAAKTGCSANSTSSSSNGNSSAGPEAAAGTREAAAKGGEGNGSGGTDSTSSNGSGGSSGGAIVADGGVLCPPAAPLASPAERPMGQFSCCVPVVVTGDFNTMPKSKTCAAFRSHSLGLMSLWEQPPLEPSLASGSGSDMEAALPPLPAAPGGAAAPPQQRQQQQSSGHAPQQSLAAPHQPPASSAAAAAPPTAAAAAVSGTLTPSEPQQQQQQLPRLQQQQLHAAVHTSFSTTANDVPDSSKPHDPHPPPPSTTAPAAPQQAASYPTASTSSTSTSPSCRGEFSTWKFRPKGESKRISDYIWFSGCGVLRPLQRWRMLTEEEIGPGALPSLSYASDHVSLCCEFEWDVDADLEWAPCCAAEEEQDWG